MTAFVRLLLISLMSFSFVCSLEADIQQGGGDKSVVDKVTFRIFSTTVIKGFSKLEVVQEERLIGSVELVAGYISEPMSAERGRVLLTRKVVVEAEQKREGVLTIPFPKQGKHFIIVLFDNIESEGKKPYRSMMIPMDKAGSFKPSDLFILNVSKVQVGCQIGDKEFALSPGKSRIATPVPNLADGRLYTSRFFYKKENKSQIFSNTRWPVSKTGRAYIFFVPSQTDRKAPSFHSFVEYPPFK